MRRSKAPSQLNKFKSSPNDIPGNVKSDDLKIGNTASFPIQSTFGTRGILTSFNKNEDSPPSDLDKTNEETRNNFTHKNSISPPKKSIIRVFNVVYGKQSKKKHKTWEGDGFLEVGMKTVTLKDEDGHIMGQTACKKPDELTEGSRFFVGSKEVEIIDLFSGDSVPTKKRVNDISDDPLPSIKKKKTNPTKPNTKLIFSSGDNKKPSFNSDYKTLIMPQPDDEHQWTFNTNHLPLTNVSVDVSLCKVLRPHQRDGVVFLYRCLAGLRSQKHTGAILADEMGLGKTLQCITVTWTLLKQGPYGGRPLVKRILIVVPSSLVQNWNNEFIRWLGSHKICTFVVDKHLNDMPCKRRIILTGTPVQNDLQEFFALVNFVNPGILGTSTEFRKNFEEAIVASREPNASEEVVKHGEQMAEELNRITNGFILRRTQSVIDIFLPQKNEYVIFCNPSSAQKNIYKAAVDFWIKLFEEGLNTRETVQHLSVITALKKISNHPILIKQTDVENEGEESLPQVLTNTLSNFCGELPLVEDSTKLSIVRALLHFVSSKKEKIVLVSNFTQTLDILAAFCEQNNFKYLRFDGSTPTSARNDIVNNFNSPHSNSFVLLLSSKAGGVGLNLIGGSRLVLFDSDWNPATDIQAMARIWREGQKRHVHIYRLLTSGTIEEKIFQRQLSKAGLSESIVDTKSISSVKLSNDELKDLFTYDEQSKCLTHDMLKCDCTGNGEIPRVPEIETEDEDEDDRDCKISLPSSVQAPPSLRMNQLFQWEHHSKPISTHLLEVMGLSAVADHINFIFRNQTTSPASS